MEDKVYTHIFNDIYSKVLQLSDNPSQFAEYLTLQIREIIGTRTVVIAVKTEAGHARILNVFPERRSAWANQSSMIQLAELSFDFKTVQYCEKEKCERNIASVLQTLKIDKAIVIPLITGDRKVGSILLLDIMDLLGIESIIDLLSRLSGVFALVIRNAHLYQNMEELVDLRTLELHKQNAELARREEDLQAANEEYQVLNEELNETIAKTDVLNRDLKESEERYKSLVNNIPVGIFRSNINGEILSANPAMAEIYGYNSVDALLKVPAAKFYSNLNPRNEMLEKLREKGYLLEYETQEFKKDGSLIWVSANYKLIIEKHSNFSNGSYIDGVIIDVTERKLAENAIIQSQQQLKAHINHSPLATIERDSNFIVTRWAGASEKIFGWTEKEVVGKSIMDLNMIFEDDLPIVQQIMERLSKSNSDNVVSSNRNYTKDRKVIYCEWYNTSLFDKDGKMISVMSQVLDVTDRKLAEKAMLESDERFKLAMKASNDGLFDWNLETNEIYYSPAWKKMLGYEDHELQNDFSIWENLTEPEDVVKSWELQQKLINKQTERFVMEFKMKHKNGYWVDILSRAEAIFNKDGKAIRIVGTHTNISERKKADIALRENEEKYRLLHENAGIGIGYYKPDGTVISYNKLAAKNMGGEPEDFAGKSIYEIFSKEEADFYYNRIKLASSSEEPKVYEDRISLPIGTKYFLSTTSKITDANSEILGIQILSQDITERKQAEEKLKASERKHQLLASIIDYSQDFIGLSTADQKVIYVNPAGQKMVGIESDEMVGKTRIEDYFFSEDLAFVNNTILPTLMKEGRWAGEFRFKNFKTNEPVYVYYDLFLTEDPITKEVINFSTISRDITAQKNFEKELILAKEKAEESDRLKSAFLANMSHEIRTPMNGILGFTSLLQEPDLTGEEQQKYIEIIQKSGDRMLNTVNDIIDISKIEAGQMTVNNSEVNVSIKLINLLSFFKLEAEKKGIQISLNNMLSQQQYIIQSDNEKLNSILTNLVKNAIKFCDKGTIEFGCRRKENNLLFYVKDTGIGIPKERHQAIFERFIQADIDSRDARQGSGLGLAISKAYVEMLGGKIWVESVLDKGSVFYFTIPHSVKSQEKENSKALVPEDENRSAIKKLNIVIAEDDPTSLMLLKIMLQPIAKNIWITSTGMETVEQCRNQDVDLVLMDIQMPGMSGIEATMEIKALFPDLPIIAQTAFAMLQDREEALEAGCDEVITKPVNKKELYQKISKLIL